MTIYNKLVRDRIPEIIKEQGKSCSTRILSLEDFKNKLREKLQEEVKEYLDTTSKDQAVEELSDVLEVVYSLAKMHGVTFSDIEKARIKKGEERGGFTERVLLEEVFNNTA
ncbi:MazG-like family protein [Geomicrobium sediminis]|uniref:House-cleaning noncanonical NTP pyrophosphatase (MazG superfamily) n=1 Tax=Geomicrobium sediminis TaxID=1347788 RepID=A0ABS2PBS9_9BACL|nr:putative house-cleaning noncanonical NTP pyrophosphatase (MazG superfamily) [Geomicrobium sediminis]